MSIQCGISVDKARIAVHTTCKFLYQHDYFLECQEETYDEVPPKKQKTRPITKDDYFKYKYVLPSSKTVIEYKHQQAAQEERDAAVALINKTAHHNVTLHFDTTSRNHIDGEWPSLIFNL